MKKFRILVLYEKDLITATFSIKFKVILPPSPLKNRQRCQMSVIICVLVYNLCYCCYAKTSSSAVQKRHSKVYGNPIAPSFYSISPCLFTYLPRVVYTSCLHFGPGLTVHALTQCEIWNVPKLSNLLCMQLNFFRSAVKSKLSNINWC